MPLRSRGGEPTIRGDMMKSMNLLLLSSVLVLAACAQNLETTGTDTYAANEEQQGIIGGVTVPDGHPITKSIVAVYDRKSGSLCTGSLLEKNMVLTAAHCIGNAEDMIVVFGNNLMSKTQRPKAVLQVDKAEVSKTWESQQGQHKNTGDVAVVHFLGDVPAGYGPAEFLPKPELLRKGTPVILAGYGMADGKTGEGSGLLRVTNVTIADPKFSSTEIKLDQTKGHGACHGDSGGPAYVYVDSKFYLWGITSRGVDDPKNDCSKYSVYTYALLYKQWIKEQTAKMTTSIRDLQ